MERLSDEEKEKVRELKESKYDTWEWNFGRSPEYQFMNKRKWDGGILEIRTSVEKGYIRDITFYGDFLSLEPLTQLCRQLQGCPCRQEEVKKVLELQTLDHLFGTITEEQILTTLFDTI